MLDVMTDHIDIWASAQKEKSAVGRGSSSKFELYGIKKLRELILDLAIQGKLLPQDQNDEPTIELLKKIEEEKKRLIDQKKIKKPKKLPVIANKEKPFILPIGWEYVRLNDIGEWGAGATPTRGNHEYYGGDIPWFKSGELTGDYIKSSEEYVTEIALKKTSLRYNKPGDVLIAMYGATIGKTSILEVAATTNQAVCACTPFTGISNIFLLTLLKAYKNRFTNMGAGGAQPNISREKIIATVIALPPIIEQNRIVKKVDELMALCDQLEQEEIDNKAAHQTLVKMLLNTLTSVETAEAFKQSWQRISEHFDMLFTTEESIEELKQTILQLAVMGKLVSQDPNDEPASELLKKFYKEKQRLNEEGKTKKQNQSYEILDEEKPFELKKGWAWARPDSFSHKITDGEHFRPLTQEDGIYFLSAKDIRSEGVSLDNPLYISEEIAEKALQRCNPERGDILIVSRGATVGRMCTVDIDDTFCLLGSVILIKPVQSISSDFLKIVMKTPQALNQFVSASGSTAQPAIYLRDIKKILFPIAPLAEQCRIVTKVDELMTLCDSLKVNIGKAQNTQALLADSIVDKTI